MRSGNAQWVMKELEIRSSIYRMILWFSQTDIQLLRSIGYVLWHEPRYDRNIKEQNKSLPG